VRWLVALFDQEVIPVELAECDPPIQSGRLSRGHRLKPEPVVISTAAAYGSILAAADVLVDRSARANAIRAQLDNIAAREGAQLDLPQGLFEELVDLVEAPRVLEGVMDPSFLSLPPEVISTVMRAHQRYVPLLKPGAPMDPLAQSAERALLPRFLCVSNALPEAEAIVQRGNERVLRARLADAAFFLKSDHAVASIDRREALDRVTFAEGLGSLRERTERLEWCTDVLLEAFALPDQVVHASRRAAHLCKHDLVSQMVGEFPELQGIMGAKYLLAEGESKDVAQAVLEHYLPRGAADDLPESSAGAVLALAERFELLLSIFSRGERPSGSSDPYGLRRAGNGVVQILWSRNWQLDIASFLERATLQWQRLLPHFQIDAMALTAELCELLRQRWMSLLEEEGLDQDVVRAIACSKGAAQARLLYDFCEARRRACLLQSLRNQGKLAPIQSVVQRASRLAEKGEIGVSVIAVDHVVEPDLFESKSEEDLFATIQTLSPLAESADRYGDLAEGLASSSEILAAFFDGPESVMVMCDDLARRKNRLNLLCVFTNQASILANFALLDN
jgi:glycyl-tRNA synthetase beta chain